MTLTIFVKRSTSHLQKIAKRTLLLSPASLEQQGAKRGHGNRNVRNIGSYTKLAAAPFIDTGSIPADPSYCATWGAKFDAGSILAQPIREDINNYTSKLLRDGKGKGGCITSRSNMESMCNCACRTLQTT